VLLAATQQSCSLCDTVIRAIEQFHLTDSFLNRQTQLDRRGQYANDERGDYGNSNDDSLLVRISRQSARPQPSTSICLFVWLTRPKPRYHESPKIQFYVSSELAGVSISESTSFLG
jgi:hypothetical protein